jgi:hypothetical protein
LDYDLYSAWLILEESSAEAFVREFLVPWFSPKLIGRLRSVAANGADDVEPRFVDLHRLMTFIHLEPIYRDQAWVWCDGDAAGREAVAKLRSAFSGWPADHFDVLESDDFERFYPAEFAREVAAALAIGDRQAQRTAKRELLMRVVNWLREDENRGRAALETSAAHVIKRLRAIEAAVVNIHGT